MSCFAIQNPTYLPALRLVTAITQANPASVTTSFDHSYQSGEIVRIHVPDTYGMIQMNNRFGIITVTGTDTFTIDIDATGFDAFSVPVTQKQCSYAIPFAEINSLLIAATRNIL